MSQEGELSCAFLLFPVQQVINSFKYVLLFQCSHCHTTSIALQIIISCVHLHEQTLLGINMTLTGPLSYTRGIRAY